MLELFKKKLPHCDTLFEKYFTPWYDQEDRPTMTRPDMYVISGFDEQPLDLDKIQYLPEDLLEYKKKQLQTMADAALNDYQRIIKSEKLDLNVLDAVDKYFDRKKIAEIIRKSVLFTLTILSDAFGQTKLKDNLVSDSTIFKLNIKQITENGFGNINAPNPYWATFETFDTIGRITQRTSINYAYHKFVYDFKYNNRGNEILVTEKYYDWSPYREKNKNDTILKTSTEKYNLKTKKAKDFKPIRFSQFQTKLTMDSIGRVIQSTDTIKCGYKKTYFQYDDKGNLIEIKHFVTRHSEKPELFAIDSLSYDIKGKKIKEVNYFGFKTNDGIEKHDREVETIFQYNDQGLLKEKLITTKYLSLKDSKPDSTLYRYEYSFY